MNIPIRVRQVLLPLLVALVLGSTVSACGSDDSPVSEVPESAVMTGPPLPNGGDRWLDLRKSPPEAMDANNEIVKGLKLTGAEHPNEFHRGTGVEIIAPYGEKCVINVDEGHPASTRFIMTIMWRDGTASVHFPALDMDQAQIQLEIHKVGCGA